MHSFHSNLQLSILKRTIPIATVRLAAVCFLSRARAPAPTPTIDSSPPVVVKTVPEAGSVSVPPGEFEIKVTFSKPMADQSWSWSTAWKDSSPEGVGKPGYEADGKTSALKVRPEPNKTYGDWINSQPFTGFKDRQGHAAVPYRSRFTLRRIERPVRRQS